ncbi:MAG: excinuclease ABC subunit UvrC [Lachnospiraceae bacterium]|jgi:excinuclease ABC subunit C
MFDIHKELKKLPAHPGVYIMHDSDDEIIYVGKAVNLKNRVRQYFQSSRGKSAKIASMVTKIERFEYIMTDSELEALVLENNLIKEHRPKYNTMLKDDKTYPYIKVTVHDDFPRIFLTRKIKKDGAKYFGPYTNVAAVHDTVELSRKLFGVRTCTKKVVPGKKERPCLYYHIGECPAPCAGYEETAEYRIRVKNLLSFLDGDHDKEIELLEQKMKSAAENLEYEQAAKYRDLIKSVRSISEKQKITGYDNQDRDVIAFARESRDCVVQVFFVRGGKLIGREHFFMNAAEGDTDAKVLESFVSQYYSGTPFIPRELMLQMEIENSALVEEYLSTEKGQKVHITVPKRGMKEKLVEMARENAIIVLSRDRERIKREEARTLGAVGEIAEKLKIGRISRMEAYDISNINGFQSVGSMVVFENGRPRKNDYRKFRIKNVAGPDDYACLEEVLTRRFERGLNESEGFERLPDLIMMDGGKGQVSVAAGVLDKLGIDIPVCGMVKDDSHNTRGLFFKGEEVAIDRDSEGFKLITRIQDEAHRFAIEYHRLLRSKGQVHSVLDDIEGIGPARRRALLRKYRSLEEIHEASVEEIEKIPSMNHRAALSVKAFLDEMYAKK